MAQAVFGMESVRTGRDRLDSVLAPMRFSLESIGLGVELVWIARARLGSRWVLVSPITGAFGRAMG